MIKRLALGLLGLLLAAPMSAAAPANISYTVGVCDPSYAQRCIKPAANGSIAVTGTLTPSGTTDTNLTQVNGAAVNVGVGGASTGTQRVTISTDSTTAVTQATASNLNAAVVGSVAAGAADSGNPVKVGGVYSSTLPTLTNGQRGNIQLNASGEQRVQLTTSQSAGGDSIGNNIMGYTVGAGTSTPNVLQSAPLRFNGASWDREFTCPLTASVNVTAGNTTQIVALSGSTVIRVCSVAVSMSLAGTAQFITGTGANCGTPTQIMAPLSLATAAPWAQSAPAGGSLFRSTAGGEICVAAVTGNVTGFITYAQY